MPDEVVIERQRVSLDELERVVRLRIDVDTYHIKPGSVVAHRGSTRTAEQIK